MVAMVEPVIKVQSLTKRFESRRGPVTAVDDVTFSVRAGGITGLLGGNGAGKTTTLAMLLGVLLPTSGRVEVLGVDVSRERFRVAPRMNFSSPYVDMPGRLTVRENLLVYAELYGILDAPRRVAELVEALDMSALLHRKSVSLSAGQKSRLGIAKSLLNEPDVLLLDEPTASLDPDTADWIRTYLLDYQRRTGAAILLASHNMPEVERLCDDVLVMRAGRLVDQGAPSALVARYGRGTLEEVFLDIARGSGRVGSEAAQ